MRPLVFACVLAGVGCCVLPGIGLAQESQTATRPATRPATQPAWVKGEPGPVVRGILDSIEGTDRLADTFGGAKPALALGGREVHVFSESAAPSSPRAARVDAAAVAGKVVPAKHAVTLRAAVVHWVNTEAGTITSAMLDVGALDGFRGGIFSVRQLLELVETKTAPGEVRRIEGEGDAVVGDSAQLRYEVALHAALLQINERIVADPALVKALALEVTDAPKPTTTESATRPAVKHVKLGGLTFRVAEPAAAGGAAEVTCLAKVEATADGALALRDALAADGVYVTPTAAAKGTLKVVALCLLRPRKAAAEPAVDPTPKPEPTPGDDDDDDLPRID